MRLPHARDFRVEQPRWRRSRAPRFRIDLGELKCEGIIAASAVSLHFSVVFDLRDHRFGSAPRTSSGASCLGSEHTVPSLDVSTTSVARPRIARVIGTTMISLSTSAASFRAKIKTGQRLSRSRNVYQRIIDSPTASQIARAMAAIEEFGWGRW